MRENLKTLGTTQENEDTNGHVRFSPETRTLTGVNDHVRSPPETRTLTNVSNHVRSSPETWTPTSNNERPCKVVLTTMKARKSSVHDDNKRKTM